MHGANTKKSPLFVREGNHKKSKGNFSSTSVTKVYFFGEYIIRGRTNLKVLKCLRKVGINCKRVKVLSAVLLKTQISSRMIKSLGSLETSVTI